MLAIGDRTIGESGKNIDVSIKSEMTRIGKHGQPLPLTHKLRGITFALQMQTVLLVNLTFRSLLSGYFDRLPISLISFSSA